MKWIMKQLGILDAYERIVVLELKVEQIEKAIGWDIRIEDEYSRSFDPEKEE